MPISECNAIWSESFNSLFTQSPTKPVCILNIDFSTLAFSCANVLAPIKSNVIELADFLEVSPLELIKEKDLKENKKWIILAQNWNYLLG